MEPTPNELVEALPNRCVQKAELKKFWSFQMIKNAVRHALDRLGYEITRKGFESFPTRPDLEDICYRSTVSALGDCTIAVIGANDGISDDPLYPLVSSGMKDRTRVVLFEPQADIIPFLEANYAFHTEHVIVNEAIGPGESLTLYSVASDYWSSIKPDYASEWPDHGAPTGVTSTIREHVVAFLARNGLDETALVERTVPCGNLASSFKRQGIDKVDVVQIDAEGFDDEVVYASNFDELKPKVVFYEHDSLGDERRERLEEYLSELGYFVNRMFLNTICVRV